METALYLKHRDGATHQLSGRRYTKLRREVLAGRGGPEVTALALAGYEGFLGASGDCTDFEALRSYFAAQAGA